jgi:DNA invertase Pin-like site-specific DNA recombinase
VNRLTARALALAVKLIKEGSTRAEAARLVEISERTLYRHLREIKKSLKA